MSLTDKSIPDRFEHIVQCYPEKVALNDQTGCYSYDFLNRRSNQIARLISAYHSANDLPVILLLEQGLAQIAATFGVLKAGSFYVPMDPSNPADRNQHMLADSGANLIITNNKNVYLAEDLSNKKCEILNIDNINVAVADCNLNVTISPDTLSYILYTSGSTGRPKGVMQNHRNVTHNVLRHTQAFNITPDDNQTLLYTSSVYGGQRDMFNALLNGASLNVYVVKNEGINGLAEWLVKNDITIYCSVATVFRMFVQILEGSEQFKKLRLIKLGGEASYKRDIDFYKDLFSDGCLVHCGLGSTETGLVRNYLVSKSTVIKGNTVPLGYPVDDIEIRLRDKNGKKVPVGTVGEIEIKSQYISMGYWRNPSLTNTVFSQDPENKSLRVYRTGDLGCLQPDGCLVHLGRKDSQIKILGNRVEVVEIENCLLRHDAIKEAVINGWKNDQGIDKLVAYLVPITPHKRPGVRELRRLFKDTLPAFMVPSFFIWLDAMPLLPNGKIDRKQFPNPKPLENVVSQNYVAPDSKLKSRLVELWTEILNIPKIGILDDFFELGGDSLNAIKLFAALEKELNVILPTSVLINNPTISALAKILANDAYQAKWNALVPFRTIGRRPPLFLVHGNLGGILSYKKLLPYLHEEQPLYAVQPRWEDGKHFGFASIEETAESYLKEIKAVQPYGPYYLGGYSFGGKIALELARQLLCKGDSVGLLAIIDSLPPKKKWYSIGNTMRNPVIYLLKDALSLIKNCLNSERRRQAAKTLKRSVRYLFFKPDTIIPLAKRKEYISWHHRRIGLFYLPKIYKGDILLFYTPQREKTFIFEWEKWTSKQIVAHRIFGNHKSVFKTPGIAILAQIMNRYLAK